MARAWVSFAGGWSGVPNSHLPLHATSTRPLRYSGSLHFQLEGALQTHPPQPLPRKPSSSMHHLGRAQTLFFYASSWGSTNPVLLCIILGEHKPCSYNNNFIFALYYEFPICERVWEWERGKYRQVRGCENSGKRVHRTQENTVV